MTEYRLDPKNPRQLTPEEARRLDEAQIDYSDIPPLDQVDWTNCPDVESVPGRCSGQPVVKGTRLTVDAILNNAEAGCSAEEIATEIFEGVTVEQVRRILAYAARGKRP